MLVESVRKLILKCTVFVLVLLFVGTGICAQTRYVHVDGFDTGDGLSHNHIYQTFQDSRGFVWAVTGNGLQFYDGHLFAKITGWPVVMSPRDIAVLFEDGSGNLWIKTPAGFGLVNIYTFQYKSAREILGNDLFPRVTDIRRSGDHRVLLATNNGELVAFDPEKRTSQVLFKSENGLFAFVRDYRGGGIIWIKYPKTVDEYTTVSALDSSGAVLCKMEVRDGSGCRVLSDGRLANITYHDFSLFDSEGKEKNWSLFSNVPLSNVHLWEFDEDPLTRTVYVFNQGRLWNINLAGDDRIREVEAGDLNSIASVYHLMTDRDGSVWLSTINGIARLSRVGQRFTRLFRENPEGKTDPFVNSCRGFFEDSDGTVYLSVSGKVFRKRRGEDGFSEAISFDGAVYAVGAAGQNGLWLTRGELVWWNRQTGERKYKMPPASVRNENIWSVYDQGQKVWLGHAVSLLYYDKKLDIIVPFTDFNGFESLKETIIHEIVPSGIGNNLFLLTSSGIFELNPESGIVARYYSGGRGRYKIPFDNIRHICRSDNGHVWMATSMGLVDWNVTDGGSKVFTKQDGLPDENLYAVYEDNYGYLWISSDLGIIQFHKNSGSFRHFTESEGVTNNEFNRISHLMTSDGFIYFGSVNGVTVFNPADFKDDFFTNRASGPVLVSAQLFSESANRETDLLPDFLSDGKLVMYPGDRYLKIRFGSPDLVNSGSGGDYMFRIDGVHSDWQQINFPEITLSGLPYGTHTLQVRTKPIGGKLSDTMVEIPIEIIPPFYLKWWFWTIVLILLMGAIHIWTTYRSGEFVKRQKELEAAIRAATEKMQADNELIIQQAGRISRLSAEKTRFYINLTHEFRTPLSLITGPLRAILRNRQMNGQHQMMLIETAIKNAGQLIKLANEMLFLEKEEASPQPLRLVRIQLLPFIQDLTGTHHYAASLKRIRIILVAGNTDGVTWVTDPDKLSMILGNLIQNAIKFSPENARIFVTLEMAPAALQITVRDNGRGIHPLDLPHIFERFYQTQLPNTPIEGGTGIGLAIVKELVDIFQGSISAESKPGEGTLFRLSLPVLEENDPGDSRTAVPAMALHHSYQVARDERPLLLFIEDNTDFQDFIKKVLGPWFDIQSAWNGETAITYLTSGRLPDLILCDAMMPYMDGFQLVEYLKSQDAYADIPILMLTARAGLDDRNRALQAGVDDYLVKPFDEMELLNKAMALIRRRTEHVQIVLDKYLADDKDSLSEADRQWLQQFETILLSQLGDPDFSVPSLAACMDMSKNTLYRKLSVLTGQKPNDYIQEARLQKARNMLESGTCRQLSEIMSAIGLKDIRHFSSSYKSRFGKSPETYFSQ